MNCIAVDDEPMGRKLIEEYASQLPFLKMIGTAKNAFEAMDLLNQEAVDLMFLDIQMPGMLGTDLIKILQRRPMVVLVTAYADFAIEGYALEVIDYLLKPYTVERFAKAAYRAYERYQQYPPDGIDSIFVNVEYALVRIKLAEIQYIEGLKDYVKIFVEGINRPILTKATLKSIEEKLSSKAFMRIHRSYIVNLSKIDKLKGTKVYIQAATIPVSEQLLDKLLTLLRAQ
jgi:DNA-binding LytR/AlgR family response regulator